MLKMKPKTIDLHTNKLQNQFQLRQIAMIYQF